MVLRRSLDRGPPLGLDQRPAKPAIDLNLSLITLQGSKSLVMPVVVGSARNAVHGWDIKPAMPY